MPRLSRDGRSIFYERTGVKGAPVLLLSGSLGTTYEMWDAQMEELPKHYDVVRYDMRGHGKSSTPPGPYSIDQMGGDVVALIEELRCGLAAFCGLSIGGVIGQWLAIHARQYFRAFILANTAAQIGTVESWSSRIATVERLGMKSVTEGIVDRSFTKVFQATSAPTVAKLKRMLNGCDPRGYISACAALRDIDLRHSLSSIRSPACILAGQYDLVATVADSRWLHEQIAGSSLVQIPAAHLSNMEAPDSFHDAVLHFLKEQDSHG